MENATDLSAYIDFQEEPGEAWWRIMVVTKTWVQRQLDVVKSTPRGSGRVVFAPMLVVPDGEPPQLQHVIEAAVGAGGLRHFATLIERSERRT